MKHLLLSIFTLLLLKTTAQDCSELFFSEYLEGYGQNKALEIYNPTSTNIDLSQYQTKTTTAPKIQEIKSQSIIKCIFLLLENNNINTNISELSCNYSFYKNLVQELYKRTILPFYIPILCLIPFLLITSSKENLNYNKIRLATFLIGFFAIIFSETTIRFISNIDIQNIGIIIFPILIFLLIYFYLFYKFNFQISKK